MLAPRKQTFDEYADVTLAEADHTARFIAGCYAAFPRFEQFAAYSMFYFAAASYSEMARRLGVHAADARFLGADRTPARSGNQSPVTAIAPL